MLVQDKCICIFHGEKPQIHKFDTIEEEMNAVAENIKQRIASGIPAKEICILRRNNHQCFGCKNGLKDRGIQGLVLQNKIADEPDVDGVRIATMHRVKGMEFSYVYILGANASNIPPQSMIKNVENEDERQELMKQEANLLSVAISRAKKAVWISYVNNPSILLDKLIDR